MLLLLLALAGACVGSFINVVVWRMPRDESVIWPGSHCPHCGHGVRWHDNIPVIGWLLLVGRCRDCHQPIARRYPLVEALTAGLWLSAAWAHGFGVTHPMSGSVPGLITLAAGLVPALPVPALRDSTGREVELSESEVLIRFSPNDK